MAFSQSYAITDSVRYCHD